MGTQRHPPRSHQAFHWAATLGSAPQTEGGEEGQSRESQTQEFAKTLPGPRARWAPASCAQLARRRGAPRRLCSNGCFRVRLPLPRGHRTPLPLGCPRDVRMTPGPSGAPLLTPSGDPVSRGRRPAEVASPSRGARTAPKSRSDFRSAFLRVCLLLCRWRTSNLPRTHRAGRGARPHGPPRLRALNARRWPRAERGPRGAPRAPRSQLRALNSVEAT